MEITKSHIKKIIQNVKTDSFWNHFVYILKRDFRFNGEIQKNKIKIWKQGIWIGAFYPIYTFELNSQNHLINISAKLNPIGKILYMFLSFGYISLFISTIVNDFQWEKFLILMVIILIFTTIYVLFTMKIYKFEKEEQLKKIFKILDIEVENEKTESEWSIKKISTRLFTYPFCLFLIILNIILLIPDGQIFLTIGTLSIVCVYLYTDLKLIFK